MKKILLSSLLLFCFSLSFSQVLQSNKPNWVKEISFNQEPKINFEEISQGVLTLLIDTQIDVDRNHQYTHKVIKIIDNIGIQNASNIDITFDPTFQKLYFHQIHIIRQGSVINHLDLSKINVIQREMNAENHIYDGSLTAMINLSDVRSGDIIEMSYSMIGVNPIHKGTYSDIFYLNDFEPIGELSLRILSEKELNITHRNASIKVENNKNKLQIEYLWHKLNIESEELENNIPIWANPLESVFITSYKTWKEVVKWGINVFHVDEITDKELLQKINQIDKFYKTDGEKIEAVLNFVQDEIRYLGMESGIGAYKPFSPDIVFKQRFGDCKDKSLLMSRMLQKIGVQAYPMLVNTSLGDELKNINPSAELFDHCVVKVDNNDSVFYYDPTISNQGGNYKNTFFPSYETGLVLKKGNDTLEEIFQFSEGRVEVFEEFKVDSAWSGAKMNIETKYYENEADNMRSFFMGNSKNTIEKDYTNYYSDYFYKVKLIGDLKTTDNLKENVFTVTATMEIDSLFKTENDNKSIVSATFNPTNLYEVIILPNQSERKTPFNLYYPTLREHRIRIKLPETIEIAKDNDVINTVEFYYEYDHFYDNKNDEIVLNYTYKSQYDHVKVDNFDNYFKQINVLNNIIGFNIRHDVGSSNSSVSIMKILNILIVISIFILFVWLAIKLYKYNPIPQIENYFNMNKPIGGWLILIAIALITTPFYFLTIIISDDTILNGDWLQFLNPDSIIFDLSLGLSIFVEFIVNIGFLVFYTLALFLFFKKRSSFPKVFIYLLICNSVFIILDNMIVYIIASSSLNIDQAIKDVLYSIIRAGIWVPYFLLSERSKETFVNILKPIKIKDGKNDLPLSTKMD